MKHTIRMILCAAAVLIACAINACQPTQGMYRDPEYLGRRSGNAGSSSTTLPTSVEIPKDGSSPRASSGATKPSAKAVTFHAIGDKIDVRNGETVNIIYDGIDPEAAYMRYESTDDGYTLELARRNQFVVIAFEHLCQSFIVDSPGNAAISVADDLRYEQVVWTPREDGTWEVRIGSTSRGCQSEALDRLNKLRTNEYEKNVPKSEKK